MVRKGADKRTAGRFYMSVVQAMLLFGSEMWVLTRVGPAAGNQQVCLYLARLITGKNRLQD